MRRLFGSVCVCILVFSLTLYFFTASVYAQGAMDAYFTEHKYSSKVYQGDQDLWEFTIFNRDCSVDVWRRAWFFFKFYEDDKLVWDEYSDTGTWRCNMGISVTRSYPFFEADPRVYNYKIELYWDREGTHYLQDTIILNIKVVRLLVDSWSFSPCTAQRGSNIPSTLSISFKNGGNDFMDNVRISIVDSAGLQISPESEELDKITAGGSKSTSFSVIAPATLNPGTYTTIFQITYDDFRGVSHTESASADVNVIRLGTKILVSLEPLSVNIGSSLVTTAKLIDGNENPVANQLVSFYIETMSIGSANTDSSGNAIITYTVDVDAGTYEIKASYDGSIEYEPSSATGTFIVKPFATTPTVSVTEAYDIARILNLPISTPLLAIILVAIAVICGIIVLRRRKWHF